MIDVTENGRGKEIPIAGPKLLQIAHSFVTGLCEEYALFQAGNSVMTPAELQALDDTICVGFKIVRRMINTLRPINKLPPEIMELIFALVPDDLAATQIGPLWRRFRSHRMVDVRGLCPVTAVCRQWRNLALSTSSLWSCTYDRTRKVSQPLHANYIDRCKGGPLSVCIEGRVSDTTLALLLSDGDRVRELYVDGFNCGGTIEMDKLSVVATLPLKNVEQCTLGYLYSTPHMLNLFGGICPKLRMLRLDTASMFPSSPIPSLTHLAVLSPPLLPNLLGSLLKLLDGSPGLQELYLNDFAFSQPALSVGDWRGGPVRLDRLERLFLREPLSRTPPPHGPDPVTHYMSSILPYLAIPATCILRMGTVFASGIQPCLQSLTGEVRKPATHLYIHALPHVRKNNVYCVRAVDTARRQYTSLDVGVFRREFTRQSVVQQELFQSLRLALTGLSLLSRIRELYIYSGEGTSWGRSLRHLSIFPSLPHLETLVLELHHPTSACEFLAPLEVPSPSDTPTPPVVCCPRLSTIVLSSSVKDARYMRWLAKMRAAAGVPLARLLLDIRRKSFTEMSEYNAQGELVRFLTKEEADGYRLFQKAAEVAPASCPTWMDEELVLA
ncbi:hypothetical protein L227DRAFT_532409 [Lentinus tigrinus ALCF2SS1-6]|uniref:Uncharacterized protein n=1 Tax=Lentinus tigrinus ALCF2SS1-6 TaxID=1328759 RepID=A0A5C2RY20_9APHY|nr:hypothetical protein L227DRAFT_532409 [Lentinus tigrinus ALCF2SS1-6]